MIGIAIVAVLASGVTVVVTRHGRRVPTGLPVNALLPGLGVGTGAQLRARLPPTPKQWVERPILGVPDETFNVDSFVSFAFDVGVQTKEAAYLTRIGFSVAAQRDWRLPSGALVDAQLVEFTSAAGAENYLTDQGDAYQRDKTFAYLPYPPWEGSGHEANVPDMYGFRRLVEIARVGNVYVQVDSFWPGAPDESLMSTAATGGNVGTWSLESSSR